MSPSLESFGTPRQTPSGSSLSGSSRILDLAWPMPSSSFFNGTAQSDFFQSRVPNIQIAFEGAAQGGPVNVAGYANGMPVSIINGQAVIGQISALFSQEASIKLLTVRASTKMPPTVNDFAVSRVILCAGFVGAPNAGNDVGLELTAVRPSTGILKNNSGGVGIVMQSNGVMTWIVQGGLGLFQFPITVAGFDPTVQHGYEIRCFAATAGSEASIEFWLDGVLFNQFSYGANTILPALLAAERQLYPSIYNYGGPIPKINVSRWRIIAGQSLQAVL